MSIQHRASNRDLYERKTSALARFTLTFSCDAI